MSDDAGMIGRSLLHYRIIAKVGAGGMGEVYRAEDTKLDRQVALKVVPEAFASDPQRLARFEREAKAVAALNHPNIVTIYSIESSVISDQLSVLSDQLSAGGGGETEDWKLKTDDREGGRVVHFITMELVEGKSLDQIVPSGGLAPDRVVALALPLAEALAAAHDRGIVHRDLKPGNIMVTKDGRVKVLDFGLAKLVDDLSATDVEFGTSQAPTKTLALTAAGIVVGTVPYLSPEYLDAQVIDHRSDLFSMGVVLYEMLTGLLPFQGRSGPAVMSSILRDTPLPISELKPGSPLRLEAIIGRCLEKNPAERYQSAADLASELRALSGSVVPLTQLVERPKRSKIRWSWVAGIAGLLALLAAGWAIFRDRDVAPAVEETAVGRTVRGDFDARDWVIAVIPSKTMSARDPDLAALNEGLALTLTSNLAQLSLDHDLQIIPASLLQEAEIEGLDQARRELGVTLALNFDTHRLGDRIRVNAQLVDVPNRRQIMAETIDGAADDLLALEETVTARVLELLRVELEPMEKTLLAAGTTDPGAYDSYLRGLGRLQEYHDPESIEAAARLFQQALEIDPDYAQAHAGLGEALYRQYRASNDLRWVDAAFEECTQAVELDELDAAGHFCLGTLYNGTGRNEEAIAKFKVAKSLDPSQDLVLRGLADAYLAQGRLELAEETYKEAVAARPHYWAPYNWLGIFYHRLGRTEEALTQFAEMVRLAPDGYLGYTNLGTAYYFLGDTDEARRSFERALEIKPDDDLALANLGTLNFFAGRYQEAVELFERAVDLKGKDYFNWSNLADAYHWSEDKTEKAPAAYRRAISLCEEQLVVNPKDALLLSDLAYLHAMSGSSAPALQALERSLELMPADIDVQHRAAQVHQALGDSEMALELLRLAIDNGYPAKEVAVDPLFRDLENNRDYQRLFQPVQQ